MSETTAPIEKPQLLLDHHLKALRLPTMLREYDRVAKQCAAEYLDYLRYLLRMAELELLDRERRATERRIRQAKFPLTKSLDSSDFRAMPTLNKAMVLELARCEFLTCRENVLLLGNSGNGKTHIALALGLAACQQGYRVRFTTAAALVHELIEARDERKLLRFQKRSLAMSYSSSTNSASWHCPRPERNCSSRCSTSATSAAQRCSPRICPSSSGPRSSDPNALPELYWIASPITSPSTK
jgi:hypothetical protein